MPDGHKRVCESGSSRKYVNSPDAPIVRASKGQNPASFALSSASLRSLGDEQAVPSRESSFPPEDPGGKDHVISSVSRSTARPLHPFGAKAAVTVLPVMLIWAAGQGCGTSQVSTPGPPGPPGTDGQLRIYGDGSAGGVKVSATTDLLTLVPNGNFQFDNLTVDATATLNVPSGTVIRCTGTFTDNGSI
jgi:hypothetical protein